MKLSTIIPILFLLPLITFAQKLRYSSVMDSLWSKNAYLESVSKDGNWILITELSDYIDNSSKLINLNDLTVYTLGYLLSAEFSADSKWLAFNKNDSVLHLFNLKNNKISEVNISTKSKFSQSGATFAYIRENNKKTDLILNNLLKKESDEFDDVFDFVWNPTYELLLALKKTNNKLELFMIKPFKESVKIDECIECSITNLKWGENGLLLTYIRSKEGKREILIKDLKNSDKKIDNEVVQNVFPEYRIGQWETEISRDGKYLFFKRENINSSNNKDKTIEIWDTDDIWIYPRLKSYEKQKNNLLTLWNLEDDKLLAIEDDINPSSIIQLDSSYALIYNLKNYEPMYEHYPYGDIYHLDYKSGKKKLIIDSLYLDSKFLSISPTSKYICFFKNKNWWIYNLESDSTINITQSLNIDWSISLKRRLKNTHLVETAYWTDDSKYVLLHDQFDIWKISVDGIEKKKLTNGRENSISYHIYLNPPDNMNLNIRFSTLKPIVNLDKSVLMKTLNKELTSGISLLTPKNKIKEVTKFNGNIENLYQIGNKILYSTNRFNKAPKFNLKDLSSNNQMVVYKTNSMLNNYDMGSHEIFKFSSNQFKDLNGVLIYPSEYNPEKKYPLIVWPYEQASNYFLRYFAPSDFQYFNIYKYIHNGYFILLPDIEYEIGNPGFSALACIEAAVNKALEINSSIDKDKLGLFGYSFGGYQAAFIATQTKLFKTVVAGAAATDLVSFYHDNWWSLNRGQMWRLENQQFRMGDSYYNMKQNYWENSPLFHVEKMKTPLLLWTGRLDTNINWYQSVFMFNAMKRLNKPGRLIVFNEEEHSINNPKNQFKLSEEVFKWFEGYLK